MTETLSAENRARLAQVSTATLSTALFKRGLRNMLIQDVRPVGTWKKNMVGEAFTLRYMPSREDLDSIEVFKDPDHPQRKAVEVCPPGHVMVIDSRTLGTNVRNLTRRQHVKARKERDESVALGDDRGSLIRCE